MYRHSTEQELRTRHTERSTYLARREKNAWREYLAYTRASDSIAYETAERFAWRRLRRALAELSFERRRVQFELDRGLVDARGISRAS